MKKSFFVVAALSITGQLTAQTDSAFTPLDEVVVTAGKFPQKQSQTGKVVVVINRETLLQNQGKTLAAVLNSQAGLLINGAENMTGTNLSVYSRGASAQYTAILINGMPVADPSGVYNTFDLNTLPVEQVERVEILKGGQSTLYGTDASAGVINIILKKPAAEKLTGSGHLAAGSYGTVKGNAALSGQSGAFQYNLGYAHQNSKGFSAANDPKGNQDFDRDGFTQNSLNAGVGYKKNDYSVNLFANYSKYKAALDDGAFRDDNDYDFTTKQIVAGLQSQLNFNKGAWIVQYNYQRQNRDILNDKNDVAPGSFTTYYKGGFKGRSHFAETYIRLLPVDKLQLVAGGDYRKANAGRSNDYGFGVSTESGDSIKNSMLSGYVSGAFQPNKAINIEGGVRYTNHSEYGSNINWNINPSIGVGNGIRVFANVSTAFRAPSLDELFAPFYGNRDLNAEKSLSWDAGFSFATPNKKISTRLTAFARRVKDVIVYKITNPVTFDGKYFNANEQQEEGFEAELHYKPAAQWMFTANYTNVQGRRKDGTKTEDNLYRRPKNLLNAQVQFTPNAKWLISTSLKAVSKRTDISFPDPVALGSYYTVDLYLQYKVAKAFTVYTDFRNLTNQQYFDIYGYNNRRFNMMAGILLKL
jgi:vitamin B12 transporter